MRRATALISLALVAAVARRSGAAPRSLEVEVNSGQPMGDVRGDVLSAADPRRHADTAVVLVGEADGPARALSVAGRAIAERGRIVYIPELPTDPTAAAQALASVLRGVRIEGRAPLVASFGRGAAVLLRAVAAMGCSSESMLVLVDPELDDATAALCSERSRLFLTSECPPILRGVDRMLEGPLRYSAPDELRVTGTNHCDALGDTGEHCASACGAATPEGIARFGVLLGKELGADLDYEPVTKSPGVLAIAHPQRYRSWTVQSNLSMVVGGGYSRSRDYSGGAAVTWAGRPELLLRKDSASVGGGLYAEVAGGRGRTSLGGGVLGIIPMVSGDHASLALAPSIGADANAERAFHPAAVLGAFLGLRYFHHHSFLEGPLGVRLDYRYGLDAAKERAWAASLQIDLWLLPMVLLGRAFPR